MASGHALLKSMPNFICSSSQSSWLLSRYSQERTQKVLQKFWNITTNAVILTNIIGQQIYICFCWVLESQKVSTTIRNLFQLMFCWWRQYYWVLPRRPSLKFNVCGLLLRSYFKHFQLSTLKGTRRHNVRN